ncbi:MULTISPECIES: TerD family protein [Desulfosporosinus]|uniref:TerD family protein n=1 Tax=Desulfosporosinus nitroreducens TaxID=2018668 RepID=A0ABT8QPW8_9FIRM|nr:MULTISPECIES: TerD family protein [Desulfosporosinus]MCO1601822.1 TerD family protein [Desulfosporosinus nitroreducens]MCO5387746.1 TerD family protein [Desulfosporosinus sp.]MDA8221588.1 TerD family protein [Desulfitobacterium hafniense]MDO0823376.1 TerD family protein [Desulfosporosinus nitroreducens]
MGINLQKGQKIDLTKGNPGLSKIMVGLGWDEVSKPKSGGLLGGLFGGGSGGSASIDCDASAILLDQQEKLTSKDRLVYFGNLQSGDKSVKHSGDNLTGAGDGDDEQINVELSSVPSSVQKIVFVVNIYDCIKRKQDFGLISNAFIRVVNPVNGQEFCRYNLTESYAGKTSLVVAEVYRHNNEWKFAAIGEGTNDASLSELIRRYQ